MESIILLWDSFLKTEYLQAQTNIRQKWMKIYEISFLTSSYKTCKEIDCKKCYYYCGADKIILLSSLGCDK